MDTNKQVINMINAIRSLDLVNFVRDFNDERGFMWASDQRVYDIGNAVLNDYHSGCSFACTLRECQYLFNNPSELLLIENNNNEPDIISENIDEKNTSTEPEIGPETEYEYGDGTDVKKGSENDYMFYEGMDNHNREAMDVAASKGMGSAIEFMTKDVVNGNMTYAEMRYRYG